MPDRTTRRLAMPRMRRARGLLAAGALLLAALVLGRAPNVGATPTLATHAFAVGQSGPSSDTWLLLANTGAAEATAHLTLLPSGADPVRATVAVAPGARQSVYLNPLLPDASFGVVVEAERGLVVERSLLQAAGGVTTTGMSPRTTWWLPYLTPGGAPVLLNPGPQPASVTLDYTLADGGHASQALSVPAGARASPAAPQGEPPPIGARIDASAPVVAEWLPEGALAPLPAIDAPSRLWYFPAASVGGYPAHLELWNASVAQVHVTLDLLTPDAPQGHQEAVLAPYSRQVLPLPGQTAKFGAQVQADGPLLAALVRDTADGPSPEVGSPGLGWTWRLAEGTLGGSQAGELRILNPNDSVAHVQARLLDGASAASQAIAVPAHALGIWRADDGAPPRAGGVELTSDVPIAVARRQPIGDGARATLTAGDSPDALHFPGRDLLAGRFLLLNMPAVLFHDHPDDIREDIRYAHWLNAGAVRVFPTDPITYKPWDGRQVGARVVELAPDLRAAGLRLIVPLVSNYQPVPGEPAGNFGLVDGFYQLLPGFYDRDWRGAYLGFARDLVTTVRDAQALDVIAAWEVGNELHTPTDPPRILDFMLAMSAEVRALDPDTPLLPGTMGANHLDPWQEASAVARRLYCELPFDAYTLHTYDWVGPGRGGDMPIDWDLDNIVSSACPSGRRLPVLVEELGTTKAVPGLYAAGDEQARINQELHQLRFVLSYPIVVGVGAWSAESPLVKDVTYFDNGRGLTSYGPKANGSGSCYPDAPSDAPRCRLEQALRALPNVP